MKIKYLSLSDTALGLSLSDYNEFKDKLNDDDHFEPFVVHGTRKTESLKSLGRLID